MTRAVFTPIYVADHLPEALEPLRGIARNLWWTFTPRARGLFASMDPDLFSGVNENPFALFAELPPARLAELSTSQAFIEEMHAVQGELRAYLEARGSQAEAFARVSDRKVAYFSMEFGIHECLPIYSGGLGVLAGDHLKSASDLGVPLVAVGIAFSKGYFRQRLDADGVQLEDYPENPWNDLPVVPVTDGEGRRVVVSVPLPAHAAPKAKFRDVVLQAWRVDVGRVPLYLLDARRPENSKEERALTDALYSGDEDHRIRQEIVLGLGGMRLLRELSIDAGVVHLNEGHSAFLSIERIRQLMERESVSFRLARELSTASSVFTTHTPVPAGNDAFTVEALTPYLPALGEGLGLDSAGLLALGQAEPGAKDEKFSMPVLAMRMADATNGVSALHGRVARGMWKHLFEGYSESETPIGSVTNGVHIASWVHPLIGALLDRAGGPAWREGDPTSAAGASMIPDEDLAGARTSMKRLLAASLRRRTRSQALGVVGLDPDALIIGFARRFAPYKRANLLLRDVERLLRIVGNPHRKIQIVFAGKAHPRDFWGKDLIREVANASASHALREHLFFVENYDIGVGRELVQGVDVWLNNPRRPLEASGTSGMKACMNGALHASVLDGWWAEAYGPELGFAIGRGEEYDDTEHGDRVEAEALYHLLEQQLAPTYFERDAHGLPRRWLAMQKRSIEVALKQFGTHRMVSDYAEDYYLPGLRRSLELEASDYAGARDLAAWRQRCEESFGDVRIASVSYATGAESPGQLSGTTPRVRAGEAVRVEATVALSGLDPRDIALEAVFGKVDPETDEPTERHSVSMAFDADRGVYWAELSLDRSGRHGIAVRATARRSGHPHRCPLGKSVWWTEERAKAPEPA